MNRKSLARAGVGAAVLALSVSACGSTSASNSTGSTQSTSPASSSSDGTGTDPFAKENKATGSPITVGLLNLENGPVTFPGYRAAVEATISYVNDYLGGVGGHPLALVHCETDGQPATSQRCANQILDKHPAFIIGGADSGASGAYPVWQRAGLAVVGGITFTPVEQNYADGVMFSALSGPDNAAVATYAEKQGVKSSVVVYTSDTQGTRTGDGAKTYLKNAGISKISGLPIPPTAADVSAQAATVVTSTADSVFLTTPVGCASMLKSLDQLGFKGMKLVIDPCTDPKVIKAAGNGAEKITWGGPVDLPNSDPDATLMMQILKKYAPDAPLTTITFIGVQSVMNIQKYLSPVADKLSKDTVLTAFRTGTDNANFAGHPFTCDNKQIPGSISVCNGYQHLFQYAGGKTSVIGDWIDPAPTMG
jgi:branched-chain amino acid transport system substrate-binding protein